MKTLRAARDLVVLWVVVTSFLAAAVALIHYADPLRILNPVHYQRGAV